ncbi:hypothetical protein ONZ45_g13785 [Pleurotus djamor]|nr:hypothetical protein ONZ45_g13785 [Pleurotus djamor]
MHLAKSILPAALAISASSCLLAHAQPIDPIANAVASTSDAPQNREKPTPPQHIYTWQPVEEKGTSDHAELAKSERIADEVIAKRGQLPEERDGDKGRAGTRRLRFYIREGGGDADTRWAYDRTVEGRWEHVQKDEFRSIERPFYG